MPDVSDRLLRPAEDAFATWARRLAGGDRAALGEVFDATYPALVATARRYTDDAAVAEDAVQDAFVTLWERRSALDPDRSLRALLTVSVRNRLFNHARDDGRRREIHAGLPDAAAPETPDALAEAALLGERVRAWIGELPPRRREAFWLSRADGLSYAEIADVTGTSVRTVENHVGAALRYLRDRLDRLTPPTPR